MSSPLLGSGKSVFIAGMTEDEFPSYYAKRDGKLEEEKRLFYVRPHILNQTSSPPRLQNLTIAPWQSAPNPYPHG
ncbi:MAG: hypothetical protein K9N23_09080 [Akkermansiaceae bacterium]|nr:hypothetical protein [Akkermansiaceae bacterium]